MPAVDDIHNQTVLRTVREEGAMNRTVGVITKCDMLQPRDEPKVRTTYVSNARKTIVSLKGCYIDSRPA